MEAGTLLLIAKDIIALAETEGIIRADGVIIGPRTPAQDLRLAAGVETILKNHGVDIPEKVDAAIKMLPLVLNFLG